MTKIVLVGYMASGKSTIGRLLAQKLGISFIDLDEYIADNQKMTVSQIFETRGEIYFRKLESQLLKLLLDKKEPFVLSLGGGTPCYADNHLLLQQFDCFSIYLKVDVSELTKRLEKEKHGRPLIANLSRVELSDFVGQHLLERNHFYRFAKHIVNTNGLTIDHIVLTIQNLLQSNDN